MSDSLLKNYLKNYDKSKQLKSDLEYLYASCMRDFIQSDITDDTVNNNVLDQASNTVRTLASLLCFMTGQRYNSLDIGNIEDVILITLSRSDWEIVKLTLEWMIDILKDHPDIVNYGHGINKYESHWFQIRMADIASKITEDVG